MQSSRQQTVDQGFQVVWQSGQRYYRIHSLHYVVDGSSNGYAGQTVEFGRRLFSSNNTVEDLKKEIVRSERGRVQSDMSLTYECQQLENDKTLGHYGIGLKRWPPLRVSTVAPAVVRSVIESVLTPPRKAWVKPAQPPNSLSAFVTAATLREISPDSQPAASEPSRYVPPHKRNTKSRHTGYAEGRWNADGKTWTGSRGTGGSSSNTADLVRNVSDTGISDGVQVSDHTTSWKRKSAFQSPLTILSPAGPLQQSASEGERERIRNFMPFDELWGFDAECRKDTEGASHTHRAGRGVFPSAGDQPRDYMSRMGSQRSSVVHHPRPKWNGTWVSHNYKHPSGEAMQMQINGQQVMESILGQFGQLSGSDYDVHRTLYQQSRDGQRAHRGMYSHDKGTIVWADGDVWTREGVSNPAARRSNASHAVYPRTTQPRTQLRAAHETNWRKLSPSPQRTNVRASASMSAPRSEMTAAEEERQLTGFIITHVTSTYQRRPVPSRERYLQEKQALGDGKKKPWAGLRLSDVGIFLSQHCQDLRKSVTKRKKLKDLLANRDELFLVNTGKGKKNNPYVYLKGTMVPFSCPFLRDEGECTFGEDCHYHHDTSHLRQKEETSMQKHIQESSSMQEETARHASTHNKAQSWADRVKHTSELKHSVKIMPSPYVPRMCPGHQQFKQDKITQTPRKEQK